MPALPPFARRECLVHPYLPAMFQPSRSVSRHDTGPLSSLFARQFFVGPNPPPPPAPPPPMVSSFVIIPATYTQLHTSLKPGIIVAIVLGSVLGFLLLIALLYFLLGACSFLGGFSSRRKRSSTISKERGEEDSSYWSRSVLSMAAVRPRPRKAKTVRTGARITHTGWVRTRERMKMGQDAHHVGRARSPIVVEAVRTRRRSGSRSRSGSRTRRARRHRAGYADYDEENEVVVIEENSPPERRRSHRHRRHGDGVDEVVVIEENSPSHRVRRSKQHKSKVKRSSTKRRGSPPRVVSPPRRPIGRPSSAGSGSSSSSGSSSTRHSRSAA